jgi:hypothetical protein
MSRPSLVIAMSGMSGLSVIVRAPGRIRHDWILQAVVTRW